MWQRCQVGSVSHMRHMALPNDSMVKPTKPEKTPFQLRLAMAISEAESKGYIATQNDLERQLSAVAGTSTGYVSKLKNKRGERPNGAMAAHLARLLRVRLEWLLTGSGGMRAENEDEKIRDVVAAELDRREARPSTWFDDDPAYPNLMRVLRRHEKAGDIPPALLRSLSEVRLKHEGDLPEAKWEKLCSQLLESWKQGLLPGRPIPRGISSKL
jgi:transcriptional regulator with XRE-family HTH domain